MKTYRGRKCGAGRCLYEDSVVAGTVQWESSERQKEVGDGRTGQFSKAKGRRWRNPAHSCQLHASPALKALAPPLR